MQESLHLLSPAQFYPPVQGDLMEVGAVEIKRESSIDDLKMLILTLPAVSGINILLPVLHT